MYSKYPEDLSPIADLFEQHIAREGSSLVGSADSKGHDLVSKLLKLHKRYHDVVIECFGKHQIFLKALKRSFEDFINRDDVVSKLLAKYVNDVLKRGNAVALDKSEQTLDNIVFLYGYIHDKDVFENHYQHYLSSRLLNSLCESEHLEKTMIAKLKTQAGYQWTNKLEGMFKDVSASADMMKTFKGVYDTEANLGLSFYVNVCTTGFWASSKQVQCSIPKELAPACSQYHDFYLAQKSGRKLEWRMDQGLADVSVKFNEKMARSYTLVVTTFQMVALLVFNKIKRPTLQQILDHTGIPESEITNHILSLCHPAIKVLLKKPSQNKLGLDHMFMINPKYQNKLRRVIIPLLEKQNDGTDPDAKAIDIQRRHQMEAAIVRVMKARKQLKHPQLMMEVISQLRARFTPTPLQIKKRIECLIDNEYLKRDINDRSTYHYLA